MSTTRMMPPPRAVITARTTTPTTSRFSASIAVRAPFSPNTQVPQVGVRVTDGHQRIVDHRPVADPRRQLDHERPHRTLPWPAAGRHRTTSTL